MSSGGGRRREGEETRRRLIEATADALASSAPSAVSMRAVSRAAGANVAAVKFHFGSREALIAAVLADATHRVSSAQVARFDALDAMPEPPAARAWLEAWAIPILEVLVSDAHEDRRLARIIGNALNEDAGLAPGVQQLASSADERLVRGLGQALAPMPEAELWLRLAVMASALAGLASGTFDPLLARAGPAASLESRVLELLEAVITARVPDRQGSHGQGA